MPNTTWEQNLRPWPLSLSAGLQAGDNDNDNDNDSEGNRGHEESRALSDPISARRVLS